MSDDRDVEVATEADLRIAVKNALDHCGLTYEQLEAQAKSGDFDSVRARIAWVAIGGLEGLADG